MAHCHLVTILNITAIPDGGLLVPAITFYYKSTIMGDVTLITGAASGIGYCTAIELGKCGQNLLLWDVNEDGFRATSDKVKKSCARNIYRMGEGRCQ